MNVFAEFYDLNEDRKTCSVEERLREELSNKWVIPEDYENVQEQVQEIENLSLRDKAKVYICKFYDEPRNPELLWGFFQRDFLEELLNFDENLFVNYIVNVNLTRGRTKGLKDKKIRAIGNFIFEFYDRRIYFEYPKDGNLEELENYVSGLYFTVYSGKAANDFLGRLLRQFPQFIPLINQQYFAVNALLNDNNIEEAIKAIHQHPEPEFLELVFGDAPVPGDEEDLMYFNIHSYSLSRLTRENFVKLLEEGVITKKFFMEVILNSTVNFDFSYPAFLFFAEQLTRRDIAEIYGHYSEMSTDFISALYDHLYFNEKLIRDDVEKTRYLERFPDYEFKQQLIAEKYIPQEIETLENAWIATHDQFLDLRNVEIEPPTYRDSLVLRTFLNLDDESRLKMSKQRN